MFSFHYTCPIEKLLYAFSAVPYKNTLKSPLICFKKCSINAFTFGLEQISFELWMNIINASFLSWSKYSIQLSKECCWYLQESVRLMQIGHHSITRFICYLHSLVPQRCGCNSVTLRPRQKRPLFCRWHFQMSFLYQKFLNFDSNFNEICSKGPIDDKSSLVQVIAWHWTGHNSLLEEMLTHFTDAHMHHLDSIR